MAVRLRQSENPDRRGVNFLLRTALLFLTKDTKHVIIWLAKILPMLREKFPDTPVAEASCAASIERFSPLWKGEQQNV